MEVQATEEEAAAVLPSAILSPTSVPAVEHEAMQQQQQRGAAQAPTGPAQPLFLMKRRPANAFVGVSAIKDRRQIQMQQRLGERQSVTPEQPDDIRHDPDFIPSVSPSKSASDSNYSPTTGTSGISSSSSEASDSGKILKRMRVRRNKSPGGCGNRRCGRGGGRAGASGSGSQGKDRDSGARPESKSPSGCGNRRCGKGGGRAGASGSGSQGKDRDSGARPDKIVGGSAGSTGGTRSIAGARTCGIQASGGNKGKETTFINKSVERVAAAAAVTIGSGDSAGGTVRQEYALGWPQFEKGIFKGHRDWKPNPTACVRDRAIRRANAKKASGNGSGTSDAAAGGGKSSAGGAYGTGAFDSQASSSGGGCSVTEHGTETGYLKYPDSANRKSKAGGKESDGKGPAWYAEQVKPSKGSVTGSGSQAAAGNEKGPSKATRGRRAGAPIGISGEGTSATGGSASSSQKVAVAYGAGKLRNTGSARAFQPSLVSFEADRAMEGFMDIVGTSGRSASSGRRTRSSSQKEDEIFDGIADLLFKAKYSKPRGNADSAGKDAGGSKADGKKGKKN